MLWNWLDRILGDDVEEMIKETEETLGTTVISESDTDYGNMTSYSDVDKVWNTKETLWNTGK